MRFFICLSLLLFSFAGNSQTVITNVYFDFARYELRPDARLSLDSFIREYKQLDSAGPITLKGYCDTVGGLRYNDLLSQNRVFAVHNYLLNNGIAKTAISFMKGYGKRQPVNANLTEEERQLNRRVEISRDKPAKREEPVVTTPGVPIDTVPDFTSTSIDSVKEGEVLRLRNINFYGGRHTFLPQSIPALNELLEVMKNNPTLEIEIHGHICCRIGSEMDGADFDSGDNQLSVNRARAVYYYLADNGIDKKRMTYKGFAALYPLINPERTETDRTLNRRVEIRIVKK